MDKSKTIQKFVDIFCGLGKIEKTSFNDEEKDFLMKSLSMFKFLLAYPKDKNQKAFDDMARCCKEQEFFVGKISNKTKLYQNYANGFLKDFINSSEQRIEVDTERKEILNKRKNRFWKLCDIFEKCDGGLNRYAKIEQNDYIFCGANNVDKSIRDTFRFPAVCDKETTQMLLDKINCEVQENETYFISLKFFAKNIFERKKLEKAFAEYAFVDGRFVNKKFIEAGAYDDMKQLCDYSGFIVVDEHGNLFDKDKYTANVVLYYLRANIAGHGIFYNYDISNDTYGRQGVIFLTNEKSQNGDGYKRAIIIDKTVLSVMSLFVKRTNELATREYLFLARPPIKEFEDRQKWLDACKICKVSIENTDIDRSYANEIMSDISKQLGEGTLEIKNQADLQKSLPQEFEKAVVQVFDIANKDALNRIFIENADKDYTFKKLYNDMGFYVEGFYDTALFLDSKMIRSQGDTKAIRIKNIGTQFLTNIICESVGKSSYTFLYKDDQTDNYSQCNMEPSNYSRELAFVSCWFVAYLNLVQNHFGNDVKNFSKKTRDILNELDMTKFSIFYRNKNMPAHSVVDLKEKCTVITVIRNAICHFQLSVELDKNGSTERSMLCFYFSENREEVIIKISVKNFIDFITNNSFSNYSEIDSINVHNFQELLGEIKKLI